MAKTQKYAPGGREKIAAPKKVAKPAPANKPMRRKSKRALNSALPHVDVTAPPPSPKPKWWRQYQDPEPGEFIGWRKVLTKTKNQVISRLHLRKPAR